MSLYTRIIGGSLPENEPKIPVHQFFAAIAEFKRGKLTAPAIVAMFNLSASEQQEIQAINQRVTADQLTAAEIHDVMLLGEAGLAYSTEAQMKARFGV